MTALSTLQEALRMSHQREEAAQARAAILHTRMEELERIVRNLSALYPRDMAGECRLCRCTDDQEHRPTCPWLQARQWVEAHPS